MRKATVAILFLSTACANAEPDAAMLRRGAAVTPVFTEHSAGLRCLGGLIDQSGAAPIAVIVQEIDDATVPRFNEERRLSLGGSFVLHTAVSRLETKKVFGSLNENLSGPQVLVLSGAWTQDDQKATEGGFGLRARAGNVSAKIGARSASDFIAGDFASSVNGRVLLSTAVGVALSRRGQEATLIVDDGRDGAEIGLDRRSVQGAQMAQRRVLEAVALVHLAHYFKVDYRACLQASYASPDAFIGALNAYEKLSAAERNKAVQAELKRLGLLTAETTGAWGVMSRNALVSFQTERNLPPTGRPSAVLFAFLATTPAAEPVKVAAKAAPKPEEPPEPPKTKPKPAPKAKEVSKPKR